MLGLRSNRPRQGIAFSQSKAEEPTVGSGQDFSPPITLADQQNVFQPQNDSHSFAGHNSDFNNLFNAPFGQNFFPTNQLGQLDRQLVFGGYGGIESSNSNVENISGFSQHLWEGVDLNGMKTNAQNSFVSTENEASSAWFMPFNMDPPEISTDSIGGLFGDAGLGMGFGGGSSFSGQGGQHPPSQSGHGLHDLDVGMGEEHDGNNG